MRPERVLVVGSGVRRLGPGLVGRVSLVAGYLEVRREPGLIELVDERAQPCEGRLGRSCRFSWPAASVSASRSRKSRRTLVPLGIAVLVATGGFTALGHTRGEFVVVMAIVGVAMVGVYGYLLPRALKKESPGGTALALSLIAALLVVPAFWSGLPLALGVAGSVLGYAGGNARTGSGMSIAALALGVLSAIAYVAIYVGDTLAPYGIG